MGLNWIEYQIQQRGWKIEHFQTTEKLEKILDSWKISTEFIRKIGLHPNQTGYPDYVFTDGNGIGFIELKTRPSDHLKQNQEETCKNLTDEGIPVFIAITQQNKLVKYQDYHYIKQLTRDRGLTMPEELKRKSWTPKNTAGRQHTT